MVVGQLVDATKDPVIKETSHAFPVLSDCIGRTADIAAMTLPTKQCLPNCLSA